jgi:hypothetical protein
VLLTQLAALDRQSAHLMRTIALTLIAVTGCSSSYMPQSRGRVAVTMRGGAPAYVRDGRVYEHGMLGSGLVDVVQGNPAATEAANEYHDRMKYGLVGMLGGLGAMIGGTIYAASHVDSVDEDNNDLDGDAQLGLGIALLGTVLMVVGGVYLTSAEPYRWDAINLFNDAPPPLPPFPGGPGWQASRTEMTKASLKMRD